MKKEPHVLMMTKRPRYLRAIPSLVILTTAMAWASLPDLDDSADNMMRRAGSSVSQLSSLEQSDEGEPLPGGLLRRRR